MEINSQNFIISGRAVRVLQLRDEYYDFLASPERCLQTIKDRRINADLLTFIQEIPDSTPRYSFHLEWDSAAVLSLSSFEHWWKKQINDKTRNMIRKAHKANVQVCPILFSDELVRAIQVIYNESPMRQGRPFKHFGKNFETLRREHATFLDQSEFFAAFYDGQIIGFIKLVHGRGVSSLMNIISMISHRDKAPTNALIAKAVEVCTGKGIPLLQYGTGNSRSIGEFKKHHAFGEWRVPRYFIPLNLRGALFLKFGFHQPILERIPERLREPLLTWRQKWNFYRSKRSSAKPVLSNEAQGVRA
jgi:hypothetical protein